MIDVELGNGPGRVRAAFNWVQVMLWRALLCLVVVPAAMVASIWMLAVAFGATSTQATVRDLYDYADTSIRAAPAGMIRMQSCDDPTPTNAPPLGRYGYRLDCQHPRMIDVPASQVMADQVSDFESLYWVLVGISTLYVFFFYTVRRFQSIAERRDELLNRMIWVARH